MSPGYQSGFQSQEQESDNAHLQVVGAVPAWLAGTLIRNGPSKFDFANQQMVNHWFDGLSMLHRFSFQDQRILYGCKFLVSEAYNKAMTEGRLCLPEFATNPDMNMMSRAAAVFRPSFTDNANVNVARFADRFIALTETAHMVEFAPDDLSTVGRFRFDDNLCGQVTTAHPHFDYSRGCSFNLLTYISAKSTYQFYSLKAGSNSRKLLARFSVNQPAYIHSFAVTERYIALLEFPFVLNPLELLFSGKPYIDNYHWKPSLSTRVHIFEKNDGSLVSTSETESVFAFHHVNAFENGREIAIDVLSYPDSSIVNALRLKHLRDGGGVPAGRLRRMIVNLDTGSVRVETLFDGGLELPRINYQACNGRAYSRVYSAGSSAEDKFLDHLVRLNLSDDSSKIWSEDGCYPGEPVFVARPGAASEDDGVLISVVLDSKTGCSFLVILDAGSMEEVARALIPHAVAFGFHGQFFGNSTVVN